MRLIQGIIILVFSFTLLLTNTFASNFSEDRYPIYFLSYPAFHTEAVAQNSLSVYEYLEKKYHSSHLSQNLAIDILWHFNFTYQLFAWPHEFGHMVRFPESGGSWWITDWSFPRPNADSKWPSNASERDKALADLGGVEVNHLVALELQKKAYAKNSFRSDDAIYYNMIKFAYPFYTFVLNSVDPQDPDTWRSTPGDPTSHILELYNHYIGGEAVSSTGVVAPWIIETYNQANLASAWGLLDPLVWSSILNYRNYVANSDASFTFEWFKFKDVRWMYGTAFNLTPLGYELYLNLYAHLPQHFSTAYFRWGSPFKHYGGGFEITDLISNNEYKLGLGADYWDQLGYGRGANIQIMLDRMINDSVGLSAKLGWKMDGYLIGKPQAEGAYAYTGVLFNF